MKLEEFRENVVTLLSDHMGAAATVTAKDVTKNNGVVLYAVEISEQDRNISPCIYLESFFKRFKDGEAIEDIIDEIEKDYEKNVQTVCFDADKFTDYGSVCKGIKARLVNTEKNRERLDCLPHRDFLDLSLVYCVELSVGEGVGSITIDNNHAAMWGVSEEQLFEQAVSNMEADGDAPIQSLSELFGEMTECFGETFPTGDFPMYVLTNSRRVNGASQIVRKDVLTHAGERLGKDYMIIPSSVHEVLLVPDSGDPDLAKNIAGIVDFVNHTQVAEEEILSNHVYRYSRASGEVAIAA